MYHPYENQNQTKDTLVRKQSSGATFHFSSLTRRNYKPVPCPALSPSAVGSGGAVLSERGPAVGAGGVRGEPHVDAADVESVVAPREHAYLLAVGELAEADGALRGRDWEGAAGRLGSAVHLHGYLPQRLPLEPRLHVHGCRRPRRGGAGREARRRREPAAAVEHAADDGVEPERENENAEQRGQDDHHVGVEVGVAPRSGRRCQGAARRRGRRGGDQRRGLPCVAEPPHGVPAYQLSSRAADGRVCGGF
uniref:Uncharacterized protein n=1 Tax=Triticum urartu TaxID=4572 RepID=A0A8R7U6E4_TRIUA